MNPKALSLVAEEVGTVADETFERAKGPASWKEKKEDANSSKKRAAPVGANTSKAAKKSKTSAPARQVRSERRTAGAKAAHADCQNSVRFAKPNLVTHDSNRRHRRGEGLRSTRGFAEVRVQKTGSRESR